MAEQTKSGPLSLYARDATFYPPRGWWQPSQLVTQGWGPSTAFEPGDLTWMEWPQRRQASSSWPGFLFRNPPLLPSTPGAVRRSWARPGWAAGEAEVRREQYFWRVNLDVGHFAPEELILRTREGFLEVEGQHDERADTHGFVSRCFTRKYKLPIGIDSSQIRSTLSVDGVLVVDAPLPLPPIPGYINIPVQVERSTSGEERYARPGETYKTDTETRHPPPSAPGQPDTPDLASFKPATEGRDLGESSLGGPGGDAHSGGSMVGHEEPGWKGRGGPTWLPSEHAGKPHTSGSADEENLEDPDSTDTLTSDQAEHHGEPGESSEELPHPEQAEAGTSQPEETPDMEHQEFSQE